jgi:hypothetical protein
VILHSIMLQIIYTTVDRVKRVIEEEQTTQWTKKGQTTIRVITKLHNNCCLHSIKGKECFHITILSTDQRLTDQFKQK